MAKRIWSALRSILKEKTEKRRRGRRRRLTPRHQHIRIFLLSTPDANAGPRQRARPRNVSAARPLALACHVGVWGGVPTSRPRLDWTRSGQGREKSQWRWGRGSESGGAGERGGETTDANGEQGKGEQKGRQYTDIIVMNRYQRRSTKRRGQPGAGTNGGGRGGGGLAGVHPDPRGTLSPVGLWRLGKRQPWNTIRRRHRRRHGVESVVA